MDNSEETRIISFCTGYGGLELGLHRVIENLRTVCYVEIEAFAVANLVAKIEENKMDSTPIWSDIKTFPAQIFRDKVHGILAGYPCQPFSHAGKRQGEDDERHLWPYILEHIRTIRPVWCFFENVSGHLTLGFQEVFTSLRGMGYSVEAGLFTASEVGAPHKRQRLFILAYSNADREGFGRGLNIDKKRFGEKKVQRHNQQFGLDDTGQGMENSSGIGRRGGSDGESGGQRRPLQTEGPSELVNAECAEQRPGDEGIQKESTELRGNRPANTSKELADANGSRTSPSGEDRRMGGKQQSPSDVPHSFEQGPQKPLPGRSQKTYTGPNIYWPARPGQPQFEWEEPRTVKPGMGRTVDGFASRVDELRLLGNGVVPAQAELAFRSLYAKMFER